jgi:predicted phage terminase large subunit-like protein
MAQRLAEQIPGAIIHQQQKSIQFSNGGWVQFKSAEEPDGLRGEGLDFIIIDEAAHVKKLQEIWEQCLRATLSDRKGRAMFISTPRGFNFFHDLYKRAETDTEWASFHFTSKDRPSFDPVEYAAACAELPALVARQEYGAEFVQLAGALFKRDHFEIIQTAPACRMWVRMWDLAFTTKTTSDWTAGCRMGMTAEGDIIIAHVVHERLEWPDALRLVANTALSDGPACRQVVESVSAATGFVDTLLRDPSLAGIALSKFVPHVDKITRAMPLLNRAEQRKVKLVAGPWNAAFLDELCSFPESDHDDMVDAATAGMQAIAEDAFSPSLGFVPVRDVGVARRSDIIAGRHQRSLEG